ncbi:Crp/Fnr family transcriptional regulator [Bacillus massilinigeriensis]|uniref:Crp/Fnr family transcriptional regulator n=1 Tax=Bacillus massilionigeriensis TaxID=1805475 RepID=UPI00096B390E|nr:Crp/Fnr family transcriptional regulator [Bacillus massilionigeriensis]
MDSCHHFQNESTIKSLCISIVPIFNHLSHEEMQEVANTSKSTRYQKGELIFQAGEPSDHLYIVHKGRVKIYHLSDTGKEQLLRILEPGDFLGELSLFSKQESDSFAEAMTDVEICSIHRRDLQEIITKFPSISLKILEQFSHRLEQTEKLVGQLSLQDVEKRTASYLVELTDGRNEQVEITLPMSKKDLASYLGTTRETISRRLSSFQDKGWIEQTGQRNIRILNIEAIKKIAEQ